jgi:histidinol dehydrogenase
MKKYRNPPREKWEEILARPGTNLTEVRTLVGTILDSVRTEGDEALRDLTRRFDKADIESILVSGGKIGSAGARLRDDLKKAIDTARENIEAFHALQKPEDKGIVTLSGVRCWIRSVPVERVGLYIPGGTAPLMSTVLMLGIPAKLAGCREIILCTPPDRDGDVHPAILYCASSIGIDRIYRVGGAQAIAAMAYGTQSIPPVDKIFGPGNSYVTVAKQMVSLENVAIDMPAGPSEVAIIADGTADPVFVASDLLSQAEHGADSQVILLTTDWALAEKVEKEIQIQLSQLPRKETLEKALGNSRFIFHSETDSLLEMANSYAPEHLIIMTEDSRELAGRITSAGSVFLGPFTPVSAGDYASGTNHTLPTGGYARAYSGLGLESFMKRITFQEIDRDGLMNLGPIIMEMAAQEELEAHKQSIQVRMNYIKNQTE